MLSKKLALQSIPQQIKGKKVLIRVDFNVPMKNGKITDLTRIKESLATINFAKENGAKAITLISHLGRPDGYKVDKFSLKPLVNDISTLLKQDVHFLPDCIGAEVQDAIGKADGGKIHLLENLRFYAAEEGSSLHPEKGKVKEKPDVIQAFRKELTSLGDLYVNDAFGTSHRAHSSIVGCQQDLRCAGFLLKKELDYFSKILESPSRPLLVIMGGAKVKDKITIIMNMLDKVDKMVITGAMAFTFLKTINPSYNIGKSLYDKDGAASVPAILEKAKKNNVELIFPTDFICGKELNGKKEDNVYSDGFVNDDLIGIDVGAKSITLINNAISSCKTIFLNGANGVFESEAGRDGSIKLVEAICNATKNGAISICGGGDTVTLVNSVPNASKTISHMSTGGGASLELIEGKILPGIEALSNI